MGRRRLTVSRKFASALERVRWADDDILDLKERMRQFFASDVHERLSERDPDGSYLVDKIRFKEPLPPRITKLTVSAIENLRAALDHGACAVVPVAVKKDTSFPFGDTRRQFEGHLKSKCRHVPDEIKTLFMKFKPYKRGNPPLWALNKLCNTHKHRTIVQPGVHVRDVAFPDDSTLNSVLRYSRPKWNRRKNEIIISKMTGHSTVHHDVDVSLSVAFGKVQVFSGFPVLTVLRNLATMVERILWVTETEARRIGIVK